MTIRVFPTLQPEELLYSACARYRDLLDYRSGRAVAMELFGNQQRTAIFDLPTGIDSLLARLPRGHPYTAEQLIWQHTTLSYYARFISEARLSRIVGYMRRGGLGGRVNAALGSGSGAVQTPRRQNFCRECAQEDLARYGEALWRRVHQLPGVFVCPHHGTSLCQGPLRRRYLVGVFVYHSLTRQLAEPLSPLPVPDAEGSKLRWLAEQAFWLLQTQDSAPPVQELHFRHLALLQEDGRFVRGRRLKNSAIAGAMVEHWGADLLNRLHLYPKEHPKYGYSWVTHRVHPRRKSVGHPLRHLLILGLLDHSMADLIDTPPSRPGPKRGRRSERKSSEEGGPECANSVCELYLPLERRTRSHRRYIETGHPESCKACGCVFEDFLSWGFGVRLLETGPSWDSAFIRAVRSPKPIWALAARFELSQHLVRVHADRLNVWREEWGDRGRYSYLAYASAGEAKRQVMRRRWLALRRENPGAGRSLLMKGNQWAYTWLRQNDNRWLLSHLPRTKRRRERRSYIDWDARDRELRVTCAEAVQRLLDPGPKPQRLTLTAIGRAAACLHMIGRRRDRLPLTVAYIRSQRETVEEFCRRRITWHSDKHVAEGTLPTYSQLYEECGLAWADQYLYKGEVHASASRIREALEMNGRTRSPREQGAPLTP
jgi:hypothetical protein